MLKEDKNAKRINRHKVTQEDFTPRDIVSIMISLLSPDETIIKDFNKTVIDNSCGTGNLLLGILERRLLLCKTIDDAILALRTIYGVELMADNVEECRKNLYNAVIKQFPYIVSNDSYNNEIRALIRNRIQWNDSLLFDYAFWPEMDGNIDFNVEDEGRSGYPKWTSKEDDEISLFSVFAKPMKFDAVIQNPPYNGNAYLNFIHRGIDLTNGRMTVISPSTWLLNVSKSPKLKQQEVLKDRIDGNVESVVIENFNNEFGTELCVPFSIVTIDVTRKYESIDYRCCGERRTVKSIYDCNLIGNYDEVWGILRKVKSYGDLMSMHITTRDVGGDMWYAKYAEALPANICGAGSRVRHDSMYRQCIGKDYYLTYSAGAFHSDLTSGIEPSPVERRDRGGKKIAGNIADNIYGSKEELENWRYFIFNNKLSLFIEILLCMNLRNHCKDFLPWIVDRRYTDEELNEMFNFTEDEISLMEYTLRKYERTSQWFRRYIEGRSAASDEEIESFINTIKKKYEED